MKCRRRDAGKASVRVVPAGHAQALRSAPLSRPAAKVPAGGGSGSSGLLAGVPKPVKEIVTDRTTSTSTWQNANGTLTVRRYLTPHFYKSASGGWLIRLLAQTCPVRGIVRRRQRR